MVSLGAVSIHTMRAYKAGIKKLYALFPSHWPVILTTDIIVRSELWGTLKEDADEERPEGYDPTRPMGLGDSQFSLRRTQCEL